MVGAQKICKINQREPASMGEVNSQEKKGDTARRKKFQWSKGVKGRKADCGHYWPGWTPHTARAT